MPFKSSIWEGLNSAKYFDLLILKFVLIYKRILGSRQIFKDETKKLSK